MTANVTNDAWSEYANGNEFLELLGTRQQPACGVVGHSQPRLVIRP